MIKSGMMLVFLIIATLSCCVTTAAPVDPPITQDITIASPLAVSEIDSILKPRVAKAVELVISQYKSVANYSHSIIYGQPGPDSPVTSLLHKSVMKHNDQLVSNIYTYFIAKLDKVFDPAFDNFMDHACKVMDAAKQDAEAANHIHVNLDEVTERIVHALEPVDQAFKADIVDSLIDSVPDIVQHVVEVTINAILRELQPETVESPLESAANTRVDVETHSNAEVLAKIKAAIQDLKCLLNRMQHEISYESAQRLWKSAPKMAKQAYKSLPNGVYENPDNAKKVLDKLFSDVMPGGGMPILRNELAARRPSKI